MSNTNNTYSRSTEETRDGADTRKKEMATSLVGPGSDGQIAAGREVKRTLAHKNPEVAKQWHPTKNGDLTPDMFAVKSNKKVWWLCKNTCSEGCPHEWESSISDRTRGYGCPFCSSPAKKICIHESLAHKNPEVAKQWHPTKNGNLRPEQVPVSAARRVWWLCENTCPEGCLHEWEATINSRDCGTGCPYCCNRKICIHESLAHKNPEVAKQWHPTKNGDLTPDMFAVSANQKVWWLCENTCPEGCLHEWKVSISHRTNGTGCPYCCNQKICIHESLAHKNPEVAKQWHPTKNGNLRPEEVSTSSPKKVWWLCENTCSEGCLHEWETSIGHRTHRTCGRGCPFCSSPAQKRCIHESLAHKNPELAKQWHPTRNGYLTPDMFAVSSNQKAWWICKKNHEWEANICSRSVGSGCPQCVNKTEEELGIYLASKYTDTVRQFKLDLCKFKTHLPFDFCIPSKKTIIEIDGNQHFIQVLKWDSPEKNMKRDVFKMQKAKEAGYKVIRIYQVDVLGSTDEWLDTVLLPELNKEFNLDPVYIAKNEKLYDKHKALYDSGVVIDLSE